MKMSYAFELPLMIQDGKSFKESKDGVVGNIVGHMAFEEQTQAATHAINNYDRLVSLLSELINSEDITFFESAIESGGPSYMNLQDWSDKARDLLAELGETK